MIRTVIAALALIGTSASSLPAQNEPPERVTLAEALARSARHGLALRIARSEASEAAARARQSAAWPDPILHGAREAIETDGSERSETAVDLEFPLVWPWRQSALNDAADALALEAEGRFRADSAEAAMEVARTWLAAWEGERRLAASDAAADVFREADHAATARYEDGDLSGFDLRRLRVERSRYENERARARSELGVARRRLATLIAPGGPAAEIGADDRPLEDPPAVDLAAAIRRSAEARPEIAAATAAEAAARAELAAARGERFPAPAIRAGWKEQSDGASGPTLGLSLPLPLFDRRAAAVEAARSRHDAAAARAALVRARVTDEVRAAAENRDSLLERASLQRGRLLAGADDLLGIARSAYESGEIGLIELLDAVEAWRAAQAMRDRLAAELVESEHELRRAIGGPIPAPEEEAP